MDENVVNGEWWVVVSHCSNVGFGHELVLDVGLIPGNQYKVWVVGECEPGDELTDWNPEGIHGHPCSLQRRVGDQMLAGVAVRKSGPPNRIPTGLDLLRVYKSPIPPNPTGPYSP